MKPKDYQAPRFSGQKMCDKRLEANLTQRYVAHKLHLTQSQVSAYENERAAPSVDRALKIAAMLGCRVEDLCE